VVLLIISLEYSIDVFIKGTNNKSRDIEFIVKVIKPNLPD